MAYEPIKVTDQMKGGTSRRAGSKMYQFISSRCWQSVEKKGVKTGFSVESPAVSRISLAFSPLNSTRYTPIDLPVCEIGIDPVWLDEESHSSMKLIFFCDCARFIYKQRSFPEII